MNRLLPEDSVIGSWDAGRIGYFSHFPVVNLDGLVNSYEYFHKRYLKSKNPFSTLDEENMAIYRALGITHFANPSSQEPYHGITEGYALQMNPNLLYADQLSDNIIGFALTQDDPPAGLDAAAWFWERMEPRFDERFGDVGMVVDDRLVKIFAKNCVPGEPLIWAWIQSGDETAVRPGIKQHSIGSWTKTKTGLCMDALLLPRSAAYPALIEIARASGFLKRFLGRFEDGLDDWLLEGEAVTNHSQHERYRGQQPISGSEGRGFLTSYHPDKGDRTTGRALSPAFTADSDQNLMFLIAGGGGSGVGFRLWANGDEAAVWRGENTERFKWVVYPLAEVAGQRLQLELFDDETSGWGHIMLDHVMLVQPQFEQQSEEP